MLELGSVIDHKYKILNEIGRGGMSIVYLAVNERANKPWAVKEVRKSSLVGITANASLLTELNMLKKLRHKGLPGIVDVIEREDDFLIVMDYIEGITLERLLREEGAQPQEKVVDWAMQLCEVLTYLHTRSPRVIYRDMKPSNIMLRSDGSVVLIDFGTAREYKETHTEDTMCLGTQGYAAPEQFGGMGQTDERTDLYSLGATMYHLVTGHNPSEPPYEMYPITRWKPQLSTGLEGIIRKCTCRNPKDRYQSAAELRYVLEHYRDLDSSRLRSYRKRLALWASILGLSLLSFGGSAAARTCAIHQQKDEYEYSIAAAERCADKQERIAFYQKAIATDAARAEAYERMVECFVEDGVLDEEEKSVLQQLVVSVGQYLEQCRAGDPAGYADLCYGIGCAYWFYDEQEESRRSDAVSWFESAAQYYETDEAHAFEWKRACTYVEIGSFYKKIVPAQISGTDEGMYGAYWQRLSELKLMNDEQPDRDLVTLRFYREIANGMLTYSGFLQEDGVTTEEMAQMLADIRAQTERMKQGAGVSLTGEIAQLEAVLDGADEMLAACRWGGEKQ